MLAIFEEPNLKTYRYKNLRTFRVGISVDGISVGSEGEIPLSLCTSDDSQSLPAKLDEVRAESRQPKNANEIYWAFALTRDVDDLEAGLFASRQIINKYDQLRAQNRITPEEASSLSKEKQELSRLQSRLRDKMIEALEKGQGLFRGVSRDAAILGRNAGDIFKGLFDIAFPDLYPKLELGSRPVAGKEVDEMLKAANLSALSPIFYEGEKGLCLVVKEGAQFVANPGAEVAKEILDCISREHAYGNKVTGKFLEEHFSGVGYGWDREIVKLVLAVLLRAGSIEITHQGRRLRNYQEPQARAAFTTVPSFRAASFSPRESVGLKTLTTAVRHLEELTGEEVDIEEGTIAARFRRLAEEEMKLLLPLAATIQANGLPGADLVDEFRQALVGVQAAASDDCVRILAGEGTSFKENRDQLRMTRDAIERGAVKAILSARLSLSEKWPILQRRGVDLAESADELTSLISSTGFYDSTDKVSKLSGRIVTEYRTLYGDRHQKRAAEFDNAIEEIKGRPDWSEVPENVRDSVLLPLVQRACESLELEDSSTRCQNCFSTISEMESDVAALSGLKAQAIARVQELTTPAEAAGVRTERVRLAEFFVGPLDSEAAVKEAVERLSEYLLKLSAEGVRIIVE